MVHFYGPINRPLSVIIVYWPEINLSFGNPDFNVVNWVAFSHSMFPLSHEPWLISYASEAKGPLAPSIQLVTASNLIDATHLYPFQVNLTVCEKLHQDHIIVISDDVIGFKISDFFTPQFHPFCSKRGISSSSATRSALFEISSLV